MNNYFIKDNSSSKYYLEGLKNFNTISFGLTLKEEYQNIINLDHDFVTYLKKYIREEIDCIFIKIMLPASV